MKADNYYDSDTLIIIEHKTSYNNSNDVYLAHIIVKDPSKQMHVSPANGEYFKGVEIPTRAANRLDAPILINGGGFNMTLHNPAYWGSSVYIMDGKHINKNTKTLGNEICFTYDGNIIQEKGVHVDSLLGKVKHSVSFSKGFALVKDGKRTSVGNYGYAPRTGIGVVKPGEYWLLVSSNIGYGGQLSLSDMQDIFIDLGCKSAFNLDGGGSSAMVYKGELLNTPASSNGSERAVVNFVWFSE